MSTPKAIFALEGLPYAGKTTLSNSLCRKGFLRLGELGEFYENGARFPAFSHTTADARETFSWFVDAEVERFHLLDYYPDGAQIIADRTIVSSLAYGYARRIAYEIGDRSAEHEMIRRVLQKNRYVIPPLIYLRIPIEKYFERRALTYEQRCLELGRAGVENVTIFDRAEQFFAAQIEYYDTIAERLGSSVCVLNGCDTVSRNCMLAEGWCRQQRNDFKEINQEVLFL